MYSIHIQKRDSVIRFLLNKGFAISFERIQTIGTQPCRTQDLDTEIMYTKLPKG